MEVSVARGRQLEALLAALVLQHAGQQLVGRAHVTAEGRAREPRGVPQRLGQPQGPGPVHARLVPAQLLVLQRGGRRAVRTPAAVARGPSWSETRPFPGDLSCQERAEEADDPTLGSGRRPCVQNGVRQAEQQEPLSGSRNEDRARWEASGLDPGDSEFAGPAAELGPQGKQEVGPTAGAQNRGPSRTRPLTTGSPLDGWTPSPPGTQPGTPPARASLPRL